MSPNQGDNKEKHTLTHGVSVYAAKATGKIAVWRLYSSVFNYTDRLTYTQSLH